MPPGSGLLFVLAGSAIAVAGLVGLNALVGGWSPARIDSLDEAAERLAHDLVGFHGGDGVLAADGRAALILDRDGPRLGLVVALRDRLVSRGIAPGDLTAAEINARDAAALDLRLSDFTFSHAQVRFAAPAEAEAWRTRLRRFIKPN